MGFLNEENSNYALLRLIINALSRLIINSLSRHITNALSRHTMSIFSTYLLMPPIKKSQDNHVSQFTTRSSPHMEDFSQLQLQAQLTPSPQGFSSLPRVSEAFTPITKINPQSTAQENKTKCNRFNMLIHNTTITTNANATTLIPINTPLHIHFQLSQDERKHGMKH